MTAVQIPVQFIGSRSFIGLATETTWGTPVTATDYLEMDDAGDTLETEPGNIAVKTIRNTRQAVSHFIQGETYAEGGWSQPFYPNQGIRALACALGTDTLTGSGPYTHTLTPREDGLPSLSIEKGGTSVNPSGTPTVLNSLIYCGALIDKVKMTGAVGAPIKVEYSIVSNPEITTTTPTTPSWIADTPYALADVQTFTVFGVTNTSVTVTAFEWELANNAKRLPAYIATNAPALIYATERGITGKLTIQITDWSWMNDALEGTLGDIIIGMIQGSAPSATITLKNVKFMKPSKPVKLGEIRVIELPFTGSLQVGASFDMQAIIVNSKSSVYC